LSGNTGSQDVESPYWSYSRFTPYIRCASQPTVNQLTTNNEKIR